MEATAAGVLAIITGLAAYLAACEILPVREILANFSRLRSLRCASRSTLVLGVYFCATVFPVFSDFLAIFSVLLVFLATFSDLVALFFALILTFLASFSATFSLFADFLLAATFSFLLLFTATSFLAVFLLLCETECLASELGSFASAKPAKLNEIAKLNSNVGKKAVGLFIITTHFNKKQKASGRAIAAD